MCFCQIDKYQFCFEFMFEILCFICCWLEIIFKFKGFVEFVFLRDFQEFLEEFVYFDDFDSDKIYVKIVVFVKMSFQGG